MNTQIIKVYYGSDALPYKDRERVTHFPITGSTFVGSSDTTKIRFYVDGYLADESALWISVSKRADGTQGSQFLTSGTDEIGDKYREMTLSGWYTEKKGDLYISLKGYQGGSTGYWDNETGMYIVQGVPVIRATGSIKLAINYAPVGEYPNYQDEMASFQDLVAQLGNKLNITNGIVVVSDISVASAILYTEGQLLYSKADKKLYQLVNGSFVVFFETYDKDTLDTKFSDKVDKLSTSGKYAYTHEGSTQGETQISEDVVNGAIPNRTSAGQLKVPETPSDNSHATSKAYVVSSISSERTFLLGKINDAGHSLGLVESTDPSKEYDYIIQLKDKAGNVISSVELDLPLEQIITSGYYDEDTKSVVLVLDNGSEVVIPVGDLIDGLVDEQGLQEALAPYVKSGKVSSVLTTGDLITNFGLEKSFVLDVMGDLLLCYIEEIENSGYYTMSVVGKNSAYKTQAFTNAELVINVLGSGTLEIDYLPIIELTNAMQTLNSDQLQVANQDNSIIKYSNRLYHKSNDSGTTLEFISVDYDIIDEGANNKITKYEITVNKSSGVTNMITMYLNVYSVGEMDALLNEKANTSGEYPLLTVGKSLVTEQIENVNDEVGSTQTNPFLFQGTGTDDNTTETPTAPVAKHLELRGNTIVWNQLVGSETSSLTLTSGHKFLTKIGGVESIVTGSGETISVTGGTDQVFDLTLLGKEYDSVLAFVRDYPLPYYEYNAGELKSCSSSKLVTIGYNQFDGEWEQHSVVEIETKNYIGVIPGETYSFDNELLGTDGRVVRIYEYDSNKTLIGSYTQLVNDNGVYKITLTNMTRYAKIMQVNSGMTVADAGNSAFHLSWDGSRTGYEPYVKHEYDLPSVELRSVCSVYDTIAPNGVYTQRIGVRTYESGDESDTSVITDLTNTYYVLETPIVSEESAFAENIEVDDFGTMEFVATDTTEEVIVPQGNKFFYPADYVLFIDDMYNRSKDGGETSSANNFVTQIELQSAVGNIDISTLVNPTIKSSESSTYGLVSPNTTSFASDKEIATTDQAFNVINASDIASDGTLSIEDYAKATNGKLTRIEGTILNWDGALLLPMAETTTTYYGIIYLKQSYNRQRLFCEYQIIKSNRKLSYDTSASVLWENSRELKFTSLNTINGKNTNYYLNNTGHFATPTVSSNSVALDYTEISNISVSADTTITLTALSGSYYPEYKAYITNSGASNAITITLTGVSKIKTNDSNITIVEGTDSTFTIPANASVELNICNSKAIVFNWAV